MLKFVMPTMLPSRYQVPVTPAFERYTLMVVKLVFEAHPVHGPILMLRFLLAPVTLNFFEAGDGSDSSPVAGSTMVYTQS